LFGYKCCGVVLAFGHMLDKWPCNMWWRPKRYSSNLIYIYKVAIICFRLLGNNKASLHLNNDQVGVG